MPRPGHDWMALERTMSGLEAASRSLFCNSFPCRRHDGCGLEKIFPSSYQTFAQRDYAIRSFQMMTRRWPTLRFAVRPPRDAVTGNTIVSAADGKLSSLCQSRWRGLPGTEVGMGRLVEMDRHHDFLQCTLRLYSFYEVHGDGSGVFHSSRNRPIVDMQPGVKGFLGGLGSNVWQFNADTHITGWLEHEGVAYDVITDEDLHYEGLSLLRRYNVVLTGTHPEYYSLQMLDAVQGFVDRGGRLMYLGGNGFYWRISFSDNHPGVIECRRSEAGIRPWEPGPGQFHHAFTGEYGGLWRRNGRPSTELTGLS